jgi:hypothetical protein
LNDNNNIFEVKNFILIKTQENIDTVINTFKNDTIITIIITIDEKINKMLLQSNNLPIDINSEYYLLIFINIFYDKELFNP